MSRRRFRFLPPSSPNEFADVRAVVAACELGCYVPNHPERDLLVVGPAAAGAAAARLIRSPAHPQQTVTSLIAPAISAKWHPLSALTPWHHGYELSTLHPSPFCRSIGQRIARLEGQFDRPSDVDRAYGHGSPLCQDTLGSGVLGWLVAGPGRGFSEEPMSGVRSVTLDCRVVPECPPGPVSSRRFWSASICA
jgi:hypothetical protein